MTRAETRLVGGVLRWAYANGWRREKPLVGDQLVSWSHLSGAVQFDPVEGVLCVFYAGHEFDFDPASTAQAVDLLVAAYVLPAPYSSVWAEGYDAGRGAT